MKLEMNLVRADMFSPTYSLITRSRVDDTQNAVKTVLSFLVDNMSELELWINDKDLINQIQILADNDEVQIEQLMSLKYLMMENGVDVIFYTVADTEINEVEIPSGDYEYIVMSSNEVDHGFLKFTTKFSVVMDEASLPDIYERIADMYDLFRNTSNPLKVLISNMKISQNTLGIVPDSMATMAHNILEYLGYELIIISNE